MDCRSRISAGKNTAFSNFREKAENRSRSPDLCIRGGERLLGVAPMADFRLAPGLCTYSGGTVPELHRIVYSPPTPDRRRGHSGFDKNMIRQFRSFVKKAGGIAAKQWFVARASARGQLPVDPLVGVYKPVLRVSLPGGFGNRWICAMSAASLASGPACFVSVYFGSVYLTKIGILYYCIRRRMR